MGKELCADGHIYMKKIVEKNWIRWVCVKGHSEDCKGAVTAYSDVTREIGSCHIHDHSADDVTVSLSNTHTNMKELSVVNVCVYIYIYIYIYTC